MSDANHNQPGPDPSQSEYVQSVFAFQMEPIDPALTAGQSNTPLRPTAQPIQSQSFPNNLGHIQSSTSLPNHPPPNPSHHSGGIAAQNNPNMRVMGNGNGMAPAQGSAFNPQSPSVCSQSRPQPSIDQSMAATQASLHNNMVNPGAQQAAQQPQLSFNDYLDYTAAPMPQYAHYQQPVNGTMNQYLGQVPSSFDFSTIPGAASHYNIGSFHNNNNNNNNNNNSSFRPNSMPSVQSQAAQPPATSLSADALSRAAESMNSQVAAETAKKRASKSATSQIPLPDKPQEANPAQPAKRKRNYAPRKPKVEGTSDPTAPKEPPKKRQRTQKKKTETTAPIGSEAIAPVAPMAFMPTATSTPTITPALLSTNYHEASPGSATSVSNAPHKQVAQLSSQASIFNMAPPSPIQVPSEFVAAANSVPIPTLRSAPPAQVINQTPATDIQNPVSAVPNKVSPVPVPNIPIVAKVPSVFPRQAPGTAQASTQAFAQCPARTPALDPTPEPTPTPTPARVSPQHPVQPSKQGVVGASVQRTPNAAFTPSPSPAPARTPPQSSTQGQTQPPAQPPLKPSTYMVPQSVGQQPTQQAVHQQAQQAVQRLAQQVAQPPAQHIVQHDVQRQAQAHAQNQAQAAAQNRVSAQPAIQHSYQHAVQQPAKPQAQKQVQQQAPKQQTQQRHTQQQFLQQAQQQTQNGVPVLTQHALHHQTQQQAQQQAQHAPQRQAQQQAQNGVPILAQHAAQHQTQAAAQIPTQHATQTPTGPSPNPSPQPAPVPSLLNVNTERLAKPVTPTIISPQADTDLYCVFGMHTLHHFRVRRSTLKHLHHPTTLTTSPFPNIMYINFNEALTFPGGTPTELSNAPGESADSHMQAFGRLLRLLEDPATQGKTACDVDTIWRLSNLQPALGLDKEYYVRWLRRCMGLFIKQVTLPVPAVPVTTASVNGGHKQNLNGNHNNTMGKDDLFEERDMKGVDLKKNKWEKALEACRKFTWIVEWRTLVARLAYLCSVDKDAGGRFVLKKPGGGAAGGGGVLNRLLIGEETIDAIVNTRTKAYQYLTNVAEHTCKNWHGRIKNGQRNGGCRSRLCMEKRMAGLIHVVKGLGLHIPKETTSITTSGSNPETLFQAQTQPTTANGIESTFHGQGTKMTIGLSIHSVVDILKAIEHERRGRYRFADAMIQQFGGKCYDCMKGSAFGPGELNPTNSLFPIIDLLYEMLWELRVKLLEWTEFPWAEKIVLTLEGVEGLEAEKMQGRLRDVVGCSKAVVTIKDGMGPVSTS
ncbi:hypothetical protein GE21DRAFT_5622 [Neurospora crassa]|uniref:Uncharacterized protein n=1 Tax=Neurospora crassa (strain ATCC 24698 / 74-OR23-1A / CBS 708.71 / DSM 1257 / FGSC 987) TaxID=367110 RepID=Q7S9R1_NEUCR|nr:hypothetical protein NCU06604 [Neurospora crassa OR74A]EAA33110.1 hypothetical protein NCU06604 [Neurospora crassa OR74A]KHE84017.1 hypothetical protein GE21DRAFT_5622 [Neurospora crassa]|eukprot:XP_962346.1 hypothetical protein NCU06604 [Neurospora crassa OR74A]